MELPVEQLPALAAVEYMFGLLCACRRCLAEGRATAQALRRLVQKRPMHWARVGQLPTPSFWLRIGRASGLLSEDDFPVPTLLAGDWVSWPLPGQIALLVYGWLGAPSRPVDRHARAERMRRLLQDGPIYPAMQQEWAALQALGLVNDSDVLPLGRSMLGKEGQVERMVGYREGTSRPKSEAAPAWFIEGENLFVPYPPDWGLLWQVEQFLWPKNPGRYPLAPIFAGGIYPTEPDGALALADLLTVQTGAPIAGDLLNQLAPGRWARFLSGPILEFASADTLRTARRCKALRKELGELISPRHVCVRPERAEIVSRLLRRKKIWVPPTPNQASRSAQEGKATTGLTAAEKVYLLSLMILAERLPSPYASPLGLEAKLRRELNDALQRSAGHRAGNLLVRLFPFHPQEERESNAKISGDLKASIRAAIAAQADLVILYQGYGKEQEEERKISPFVLESWGGYWYLLAYCYQRKANRTFRLDRMRLKDEREINA